MAAEEERLNAEIERAKEDLARDLEELRSDAADLGKKLAIVVGAVVAAYAAFKIIRAVLHRRR